MDSFILIALLGFAAGVAIYYFDMKKGSRLYRWWYNLTHQHPLEEDVDKGFVHSRSFRQKLIIALIIAVVELVIAYLVGGFHIIHDFITAASIFSGLLAGFVAGPLALSKLPGGLKTAKQIINKAEELEAKYIDDSGEKTPIPKSSKEPIPAKPKKEVKPESKEKELPESKLDSDNNDDKDWRSGIKDFLDK